MEDGNGFKGTGQILGVDVSQPEALTVETLTQVSEGVSDWAIGEDKLLVYSTYIPSSSQKLFRARKPNNELVSLSDVQRVWRGFDQVFIQKSNWDIERLSLDGSNHIVSTFYDNQPDLSFSWYDDRVFRSVDHLVLVTENQIIELENPEGQLKTIESGLDIITFAVASENAYYLAGFDAQSRGNLLRLNTADDTIVPLLEPGTYDIGHLDVSEENIVWFEGVRLLDSSRVLAEISNDGIVTLMDEIPFDGQVRWLKRIR